MKYLKISLAALLAPLGAQCAITAPAFADEVEVCPALPPAPDEATPAADDPFALDTQAIA